MALFPAVPAKEGRCEKPASATLQVFGIVDDGDQFAEFAAGLAAGEYEVSGIARPRALPSCWRGHLAGHGGRVAAYVRQR